MAVATRVTLNQREYENNMSYESPTLKMISKPQCTWLRGRGRASHSRLRGPGFESCAAVLKPWASFFTLHCCINEYLAIDKWWTCVRAAFAH